MSRVTLSELQIPNDEVVVIHIFHGDCRSGTIECALILICVEDLKSQVNGLGVKNFLIYTTSAVLGLDCFLSEVHSSDHDRLTIDELITREYVERSTHEEVIVGSCGHWETITEQIVLSIVEIRHERVRVEGEEVDLACLHTIDIEREDDATLTGLGANEITLLEGVWLPVFIQFVIFP